MRPRAGVVAGREAPRETESVTRPTPELALVRRSLGTGVGRCRRGTTCDPRRRGRRSHARPPSVLGGPWRERRSHAREALRRTPPNVLGWDAAPRPSIPATRRAADTLRPSAGRSVATVGKACFPPESRSPRAPRTVEASRILGTSRWLRKRRSRTEPYGKRLPRQERRPHRPRGAEPPLLGRRDRRSSVERRPTANQPPVALRPRCETPGAPSEVSRLASARTVRYGARLSGPVSHPAPRGPSPSLNDRNPPPAVHLRPSRLDPRCRLGRQKLERRQEAPEPPNEEDAAGNRPWPMTVSP